MYPTAARTTGVAWASAVGRVGSVAGSMLGAPLLAVASGPQWLFASMAVPALVAAAALAALSAAARRMAPANGE
jgi:MFS transporter, AAHS family, 4-hydroxybenzoate transporter